VSLQERMREMFSRMVEAKDASLVDTYYDPDFRMITNGQEQTWRSSGRATRGSIRRRSPTGWSTTTTAGVESGNRLAARVWITVQRPGERATRIEVVLVAEYRDGKLLWLKEVTWPDWSRLSAFDEYGGPG